MPKRLQSELLDILVAVYHIEKRVQNKTKVIPGQWQSLYTGLTCVLFVMSYTTPFFPL